MADIGVWQIGTYPKVPSLQLHFTPLIIIGIASPCRSHGGYTPAMAPISSSTLHNDIISVLMSQSDNYLGTILGPALKLLDEMAQNISVNTHCCSIEMRFSQRES